MSSPQEILLSIRVLPTATARNKKFNSFSVEEISSVEDLLGQEESRVRVTKEWVEKMYPAVLKTGTPEEKAKWIADNFFFVDFKKPNAKVGIVFFHTRVTISIPLLINFDYKCFDEFMDLFEFGAFSFLQDCPGFMNNTAPTRCMRWLCGVPIFNGCDDDVAFFKQTTLPTSEVFDRYVKEFAQAHSFHDIFDNDVVIRSDSLPDLHRQMMIRFLQTNGCIGQGAHLGRISIWHVKQMIACPDYIFGHDDANTLQLFRDYSRFIPMPKFTRKDWSYYPPRARRVFQTLFCMQRHRREQFPVQKDVMGIIADYVMFNLISEDVRILTRMKDLTDSGELTEHEIYPELLTLDTLSDVCLQGEPSEVGTQEAIFTALCIICDYVDLEALPPIDIMDTYLSTVLKWPNTKHLREDPDRFINFFEDCIDRGISLGTVRKYNLLLDADGKLKDPEVALKANRLHMYKVYKKVRRLVFDGPSDQTGNSKRVKH